MRLYQTPGGVWTGTEKNHNAALKAEGLKPADMPRKQVDVPTDKPGLLEFLTFHNVNVINPQAPLGVDVSAGAPLPPASAETTVPKQLLGLDDLFAAAALTHQLDLASAAVDRASAKLRS